MIMRATPKTIVRRARKRSVNDMKTDQRRPFDREPLSAIIHRHMNVGTSQEIRIELSCCAYQYKLLYDFSDEARKDACYAKYYRNAASH